MCHTVYHVLHTVNVCHIEYTVLYAVIVCHTEYAVCCIQVMFATLSMQCVFYR